MRAVVISASAGIQVNTRRMFESAREYGVGVWIVVNHIDAANIDLSALVGQVQEPSDRNAYRSIAGRRRRRWSLLRMSRARPIFPT